MKKLLTLGLGGAALIAASGAHANVTLYGMADMFFESADNGKATVNRLSSGGSSVSRWGIRGSEDLGGGLKAQFQLESGIFLDDGTTTTTDKLFTRWAFVGLTGSWGAIDLGRMWSPTFVVGLQSDVLARNRTSLVTNMFRSQTSATATVATPGFQDNSIRYTSPKFKGVSAQVAVSPGESTNGSRYGTSSGFNVQYADGPAYLGYGYQRTDSTTNSAATGKPTTAFTQFLGATYKVGSVTLYGTLNLNTANAAGIPRSTNSQVSARWAIEGPHAVLLQLARRHVSGSTNSSFGWQAGYDYSLSKSTTIYARYAKVNNRDLSAITLNGVALNATGDDPSFAGLGLSHRF